MSIFTRTRAISCRGKSSQLRLDTLETRIVPSSSIARALNLPAGSTVDDSGTQYLSLGAAHNFAADGLAGFGTGPDADFVVLSTGDATKGYAPRPSSYPHFGLDFGKKGAADDLQHLQVTVPVAAGQTHVMFDFDFMTDETPGSGEFDDAFSVLATPVGAGSAEILVQMNVKDTLFVADAPVNAIYRRHTGRNTADYSIPVGATSVQFDFYIADRPTAYNYPGYPSSEGDGTGDTAVVIDNFRVTSPKQIVWLNFENGGIYNFLGNDTQINVPAFQPGDIRSNADRTTLINDIFTNVAAKFAEYDIGFTLTQPTSAQWGFISIGGSDDNVVTLGADADPRRVAEFGNTTTVGALQGSVYGLSDMDYGNTSLTSVGFVNSANFGAAAIYAGDDVATLQQRLEVTIAQEVAHSLGAPHVDDSFDDNIMADLAPRSPTATFEHITRALAGRLPDGRTDLNIHSYLASVLGSSIGSGYGNSAPPSKPTVVVELALPQVDPPKIVTISLTDIDRASDSEDAGSGDAIQWFTFSQLKAGLNQIVLPKFGKGTRISFFGSTVPGGPADFFSGTPTAGNMTYADGFVPLYDQAGNLNTSLTASKGSLGSLTEIPGGIAISLSPFSTPGLTPVDPKVGFTFEDDNGDTVTVKLGSKTGTAAIELNDSDGDGKGSIARIELQGTTIKDKLSVKVKKGTGDGMVDIGSISGSALGSLSAKYSDLTGTGLNFGQQVKTIELRDVKNGADILVGGSFNTKTQIKLHDVADGTDISVDGQLKLQAARIGDGTIQAAMLTKLSVKGDSKAIVPISGDFRSDVTIVPGRTLSAKEAKLNLLGSVSIAGRTQGATFVVPGNAGPFKTGSFENSSLLVGYTPTNASDPFAGGVFDGEFKLSSFSANGFDGMVGSSFENSNLIAAKFGTISLASVRTDNTANAGLDFGIAAKTGVAKNLPSIRVKTGTFSFDPTGVFPQSLEDFFVKVI